MYCSLRMVLHGPTSASHQWVRCLHQRLLWTTFHGQLASHHSHSSVSFSCVHPPQRSSLQAHKSSTTGLIHHTTHTRIVLRSAPSNFDQSPLFFPRTWTKWWLTKGKRAYQLISVPCYPWKQTILFSSGSRVLWPISLSGKLQSRPCL